MTPEVQIAIISTCAAIGGSVVGGVVTYFTTRRLKSQEWRQEQLVREVAKREQLYADLITECGRLAMGSVDNAAKASATEFTTLHSIIGRIRIIASPEVRTAANALARQAMEQYRPHKDPSSKEALEAAGAAATKFANTREEFCDRCRIELKQLADRGI